MTAVATMAGGVPKFLIDARTAPRIAAVLAFVAFGVGPACGHGAARRRRTPLPARRTESVERWRPQDCQQLRTTGLPRILAGDPAPALLAPGVARAGPGHAPVCRRCRASFAIGGYWGTVAWIGLLGALGSMFVWQAGYIVTRDVGSGVVRLVGRRSLLLLRCSTGPSSIRDPVASDQCANDTIPSGRQMAV